MILPAERDQAELQVEHLGALHINEPAEEVVPHAGEGQDRGGQQGGPRKGQDDLPEDAEPSHPIDDGGLFKVTRDALEELRHQQDVGGLKEVQDQQSAVGVHEVHIEKKDVPGHEEDEAGDHHGADHDREQEVLERKLQPRESVADQRIEEEIQ